MNHTHSSSAASALPQTVDTQVSPALQRVLQHLEVLYPGESHQALAESLLSALLDPTRSQDIDADASSRLWDQQDCYLVTYADSLLEPERPPLQTLHEFLSQHLQPYFSGVHILPFFPFTSDDGFAISDYRSVREDLGEWKDVSALANDFRLMADLVINHCSASHPWFDAYSQKEEGFEHYFIEAGIDEDLQKVVRPRNSPLLRPVKTRDGTRHLWCTFGHDQLDLNFKEPRVLLEMVGVLGELLKHGVRGIRLDAIAYLWKQAQSSCINLPQTHEVVRLLRTLLESYPDPVVLLTETNVPSHENLSYFGNGNEAHVIYNFSLPPLVLHALLSGDSRCLKAWMMSMPPACEGTAYFNFLASHDGIGLRPAEGLLDEQQMRRLLDQMEQMGGEVSWRSSADGVDTPYEINISLIDAFKASYATGVDAMVVERFLCAHAILLAIEGIPAIYIHSLLATGNDHERVKATGHARAINRHQWQLSDLEERLDEPTTVQSRVFRGLLKLLSLRRRQPAFHPNATQFTLQLGHQVFGFWRQSQRRDQSIFCLNNLSHEPVNLALSDLNLISTEPWHDIMTGQPIEDSKCHMELAPYQVVWLTNQAF